MKEFSKTKFIGKNKTDSRKIKITVRNNKSSSIKIKVQDQIPVSVNSDISVDVGDLDGGSLDEEKRNNYLGNIPELRSAEKS